MECVNTNISKLMSSASVKIDLTADFQAQQSPFQPQDYHPAVSHTKSLMLDWCIPGVAFADSMDLRVERQVETLSEVYTALGWKEAVHATVRAICMSKVMLVCKEGQVSGMEVWGMSRAKKFWSQEVTCSGEFAHAEPNAASIRVTVKTSGAVRKNG